MAIEQDLFALAVVIFQLLNFGIHPFSGLISSGDSATTTDEKVSKGYYPYGAKSHPSIKPIKGVLRPTLGSLLPKLDDKTGILVDVGLNADCKPEQLVQFAILGNLYAKHILNIENPKVGLLNMGEEEGKGNLLAQTTYPLLKENTHIEFMGNVEGRDIFNDKVDVIVCDGFTGNIVLKTAEAMYDAAVHQGLGNDSFFNRYHFENYGGTPILGVNKPVIIGHGISNTKVFCNMIKLAEKMIDSKFCEIITTNFENL